MTSSIKRPTTQQKSAGSQQPPHSSRRGRQPRHSNLQTRMLNIGIPLLIAQVPDTEFDEQGNIVGWGVTLVLTSHHFQIRGQQMFTWCAFDTVLFPPSLHAEAEVHSVCANIGSPISFTITSEGEMKNLFLPETYLSLIMPTQRDECIRATFCQQPLFFQSEQIASSWLTQHSEALLLSVKDAAILGKAIARKRSIEPVWIHAQTVHESASRVEDTH